MTDSHHDEAGERPSSGGPTTLFKGTLAWWLTPLLIGVGLAVAFIAFGRFGPKMDLFYSVF